MYPQQYFKLFPTAPTEPKVFVAMPFHDRYLARWEKVIRPAILNVGLEPLRVDIGFVSDSILTQMLQGIARSRLVFADVSAYRGHRNPNVMYEVGIAHAVRPPNEVVVFRDDKTRLPFDVANVRVNLYKPDRDPDKAEMGVRLALKDALKELDLSNSMAVEMAIRRIDQPAFNLLVQALVTRQIHHPTPRNLVETASASDNVRALTVLLELGLLKPQYPDFYELAQKMGSPELQQRVQFPVIYRITELGSAVIRKIALQSGFEQILDDPNLSARIEECFSDKEDDNKKT